MQKREWLISICMLCVLALCAAGVTAFVLQKNQSGNVAAFENRFLDLTQLGVEAAEGVELNIGSRYLVACWQAETQAFVLETAVQPLKEACGEWQIDLSGGGTQNARQKERWGYQVWLELVMLSEGEAVATNRTELPMEADRTDRTRVYTVHADASAADSWQLRVIVTPVDGALAEGALILKNWEVHAR